MRLPFSGHLIYFHNATTSGEKTFDSFETNLDFYLLVGNKTREQTVWIVGPKLDTDNVRVAYSLLH